MVERPSYLFSKCWVWFQAVKQHSHLCPAHTVFSEYSPQEKIIKLKSLSIYNPLMSLRLDKFTKPSFIFYDTSFMRLIIIFSSGFAGEFEHRDDALAGLTIYTWSRLDSSMVFMFGDEQEFKALRLSAASGWILEQPLRAIAIRGKIFRK